MNRNVFASWTISICHGSIGYRDICQSYSASFFVHVSSFLLLPTFSCKWLGLIVTSMPAFLKKNKPP